ncbi:ABC transporter permease [Paenibacillus sp. CF384]|uniref:ABC transporter permease n=1 Tax=Paenibacillus sp. CF384 TaxID=1884382 RepID=UPI0008946FA1|nr:ABC-2 family transporter protein [Paenibacillus sp. CF384]SDW86013.1 ABC-2 type transport system permease protein [Paenibacillus sp. CF384]
MSMAVNGEKEKDQDRFQTPAGTIRFLLTCWKVNLASSMEYRMSFFLMAGMMFINNFMWLFFWTLFFDRFQVVNGWELSDVMMLWAVGAGGFGWANMLFGNFHRIAPVVSSGQLDVYLSQPKPVLLHVLASRMSLTAAGDFLFGLAVYAWVGNHTLLGAVQFGLGLLISGLIFMGVMIIAGSFAFFFGNAEGIAGQVFNSFVALSTYPSGIFRGAAKLLLFTIVPAGFISYLPIGLMRDFDPVFFWQSIAMTIGLLTAGTLIFRLGLKRYTSGNAIAMRG